MLCLGDHAYGDRPRKNPLDDALLRKIWGLKGRQRLVKELNLDWIHGEQLSNFGDEQGSKWLKRVMFYTFY